MREHDADLLFVVNIVDLIVGRDIIEQWPT